MEKKQWVKPELMKVDLVPEEAVICGCKLRSGRGGAGGQGNCSHPTQCFGLTS